MAFGTDVAAYDCCCQCKEPRHSREDYGETCLRCGRHRPPNGRIVWLDDDDRPELLARELEMIREDVEQHLEEYRSKVLEVLRRYGPVLRERAEEIVGEEVQEVQVHGSVLHPEEFTARSDVDIAIVFDAESPEDDKYDPVQSWSDELSREIPPVCGSHLDVCAFGRHGTPTGEKIA